VDFSPLGEAALTVLIGVTVYVFGQIIVKFFIEPLDELSRMKGRVLDSLVYYSNVYTNPAQASDPKELTDLRKKGYDDLRQKASLLMPKIALVRMYRVASFFRIVPKKANLQKVHSNLILLSNACTSKDPNISSEASKASDEIVKLLASKDP
jgi:hypothetical protein